MKEHLHAIREQEAQILEQIEAQRETARTELVELITKQIADHGFEPLEIVKAVVPDLEKRLKPKAKAKTAKASKAGRAPTKILIDPENPENTYTRGPAPAWMKERLQALGLDPANKEHVKQFKTEVLVEQQVEPVAQAA